MCCTNKFAIIIHLQWTKSTVLLLCRNVFKSLFKHHFTFHNSFDVDFCPHRDLRSQRNTWTTGKSFLLHHLFSWQNCIAASICWGMRYPDCQNHYFMMEIWSANINTGQWQLCDRLYRQLKRSITKFLLTLRPRGPSVDSWSLHTLIYCGNCFF